MANYYTEASFIIPCTQEQAKDAVHALSAITDELDGYAEELVRKGVTGVTIPEDTIILHCFSNHPDQTTEHSNAELQWEFTAEAIEEGLWVHADESINTEHAAVFTQAVLKAFGLSSLVVIEAAHTCSKARTDAFGGHACVVSKDFIRWDGLADFVNAEIKAHECGERFYICEITEVNGEYEYLSRFLMKCSVEDDPEDRLDDIFVNYRGKGDKESDDFVWYCDGTAAKNPCMNEITPYEFEVMQSHLSVL